MLLDFKRKALGHHPCVAAAVAAGAIGSAAIGAAASSSAANTQASAQQNASNEQMSMFNTINGQEQPFMNAGYGATTGLQQLLGETSGTSNTGGLANGYLTQTMSPFSFDPSSITSSPGYQFSQTQGLQQTQNALAPNVGALSGPTLQALTNYATGNAEQYYNNYFNQAQSQYSTNLNSLETQQNNIFSRLSGIAGLGQNAASNTGTAGTQLGTGAAQATAASGASEAAGTIGVGNSLSGGVSGAANGYALNSILSNNSGASGLIGGQSALNVANASADPIASLNASQGWTGAS